jgi:hypothetical protein
MDYPNDEWQHKGATLSDKTARQEFGLTQDEIYDAIHAGTLQYRQNGPPPSSSAPNSGAPRF